ncbi:hypothetical protein LPJ61_002881 [Coemansia biformis]|uniref:FHF complex subunit HOOK-interacting protein C-terminal domain-containing protein n=1 Tax=Coemansia biformis TaxID=1286918 RepID=A0A9W8CY87_9FUNG|nr:hypothetical protein LPJ61_002881 [Coemansia biformis]
MDRVRTIVDNVTEALDGPTPTRRDRLVESWARIQEYYTPQRSDDLRQITIADTTIPHHLECMLRIVANEIIDDGEGVDLAQPLEFGPCVEYLLQYHVLSDLVDLADRDTPRGMRAYVVRFFDLFIGYIPLGLLPESAIRLPLVAIMRQCLYIVQTSPTTPMTGSGRPSREGGNAQGECRLGRGYHSIHRDRSAVITCHDLLHLIVTLFRRLREHSSMVDLFFDWGNDWPRAQSAGGGAPAAAEAAANSELAVSSLRSATSDYAQQSARGHELFIVHVVVEYLLAPGLAGPLAREALVLVVQVLLAPEDRGKYVSFLLDQARIVEVLVEHMGYLYSQMPMYRPDQRSTAAAAFSSTHRGPRRMRPLDRRMASGEQSPKSTEPDVRRHLRALLEAESLLRSRPEQEQREGEILGASRVMLKLVDAFFVCWELLDEIACVSEGSERVVDVVQSQLINALLRTHIEPSLLSASTPDALASAKSQVITAVSYLNDLVSVTHSDKVLDALFTVLLGADMAPERAPRSGDGDSGGDSGGGGSRGMWSLLSKEDQELLDSIGDEAMRVEAARLLLPAGIDVSQLPPPGARPPNAPSSLRAAMISWMEEDDGTHLALNTLRLFDTMLGTMNQFAYTSLVLRNFGDGADSGGGAGERVPALGLGSSAAVDQELVRAVVERFLDATPGAIATAMPDVVVAAAMRIEQADGAGDATSQRLEVPQRNFQNMRSHIMRENKDCDAYVDDCLQRLRFAQTYIRRHWRPQSQVVRGAGGDSGGVADCRFFPGAFLASVVHQLTLMVKRHMAFNLMLTSIVNKLACIGDPALTSYLFLANSATMSSNMVVEEPGNSGDHKPLYLYDAFVWAAADAYVKSERIPRFSARLAKQLREGVENAVRVGAVHSNAPSNNGDDLPAYSRECAASEQTVLPTTPSYHADNSGVRGRGSEHYMDVEPAPSSHNTPGGRSGPSQKELAAAAAVFLGTPIKRFVHGYILLDEFGKEMAAMAMALHSLELDWQLEGMRVGGESMGPVDEYADLLEYYDPSEPAYRQAALVHETLGVARHGIIDLRTRSNRPLPDVPDEPL